MSCLVIIASVRGTRFGEAADPGPGFDDARASDVVDSDDDGVGAQLPGPGVQPAKRATSACHCNCLHKTETKCNASNKKAQGQITARGYTEHPGGIGPNRNYSTALSLWPYAARGIEAT